MKVIIAGSRIITRYGAICEAIVASDFKIDKVVSGGARGVDELGERWARMWGKPIERFPADWEQYGKAAGYIRNDLMAKYADALIAVWDGESKGTKHMIEIMKRLKKPIFIYENK